jgi:hypothetical protein
MSGGTALARPAIGQILLSLYHHQQHRDGKKSAARPQGRNA